MAALPPEELLIHTLDLLESRLRRLEYIFKGGGSDPTLPKGTTATARLSRLQDSLGHLAARSRTVEQLLKLQAHHPDIFKPTPAEDSPAPHDEKLALVLSEAPTYLTLASQLRSLQDVTVPPTTSFTHLVSQTPRFAATIATQEQQANEIAELRKKSALFVSRWYEIQVLGLGRCWAEWEGKLKDAERAVRRAEIQSEVD